MSPRKVARREPIRPSPATGLLTPETTPQTKRTYDPNDSDLSSSPVKRLRLDLLDEKLGITDIDPLLLSPSKPSKSLSLSPPPQSPNNIYNRAIALFQRGSSYRKVIGREKERQFIYSFIGRRLLEHNNGALYLSGLPGTGKSALLSEVVMSLVEEVPQEYKPKVAIINCMIADQPEHIYSVIYDELSQNEAGKSKGKPVEKLTQSLRAMFTDDDKTRRYVLVLDELDHIITADQEVLFRIFQWAFLPNSNLVLVGIANALDLTDRFLPRLRSQNFTPELLVFVPYTSDEIANIIQQRLRSLTPEDGGEDNSRGIVPLMHPAAIQMCARKIAKGTGDLRKAFDVCCQALEKVLQEVTNPETLELESAPKVKPNHIAQVCSTAFGETAITKITKLNLQQKAVLCVLVSCERDNSYSSSLTVGKLFDRYSQLCKREKLLAHLSLNEFYEVISALESIGLLNVAGLCGRKGMGASGGSRRVSRGGSGAGQCLSIFGFREEYGHRRIASNVHAKDLAIALTDIPILKPFIAS